MGAIKADWYPLFAARKIAPAATAVLPLPTSPCTSRFITPPEARSIPISSRVRRCAPVRAKGKSRANSAQSAA